MFPDPSQPFPQGDQQFPFPGQPFPLPGYPFPLPGQPMPEGMQGQLPPGQFPGQPPEIPGFPGAFPGGMLPGQLGGMMPPEMLPGLQCPRFILRRPYRNIEREYMLQERAPLGTGQFGIIRSCVKLKTGEVLACKSISKSTFQYADDAEAVGMEVAVMEMLNGHPHIIRMRDAFEDSRDVHIVMEMCTGGDLHDRVKTHGPYSEEGAARVLKGLVEALLCCHGKGVMHRDVKPENVLICDTQDDTRVKLIDFGVATFIEPDASCMEFVGTPMYIAPEAIKESEVSFSSPRWQTISDSAKNLVKRMLTKDPKMRILGAQVLEHPWVKYMTDREEP
ncbi:unnamed protein product [Closterium sp. Yama58-4]|nr:unnamed protein product [Closterium sp. Yama58-4]